MFSLDLAPEGNFHQAQADILAHVINDLENVLSGANKHEDQAIKVRLNHLPYKKCYFKMSVIIIITILCICVCVFLPVVVFGFLSFRFPCMFLS